MILAGTCCKLYGDNAGAKFWYNKARNDCIEIINEQKRVKETDQAMIKFLRFAAGGSVLALSPLAILILPATLAIEIGRLSERKLLQETEKIVKELKKSSESLAKKV